jgi:hypothetical protein
MAPATLCLNMIVRNEAPTIARCLASVHPYIDRWEIVDTGSTDATPDIVQASLHGVPGRLHRRPWVDFSHNRNEALAFTNGQADYVLLIDADDVLEADGRPPALDLDCYLLRNIDTANGTTYSRPHMLRNNLPWLWEGVVHEALICDIAYTQALLPSWRIHRNHDGARRRDAATYRRDAADIQAAMLIETRPFMLARYRFYLAQSFRDCGEDALAVENYLERARLGFWQDEVFVSLVTAATLQERLGLPADTVLATWAAAVASKPDRAEALHGAARYCRIIGRAAEGCALAQRGLAIPLPDDGLFVEPWVYSYGLLDEFAVNAFRIGQHRACLEACLHILTRPDLPDADRVRVAENALKALARLQ